MSNATLRRVAGMTQAEARATSSTSINDGIEFEYDSVEEAWPTVDPGLKPFHNLVLVQYKRPKTVSKGGIHIIEAARQVEAANSQVVKVIALGELAFKNRETGEPWKEGAWCKVGDFVRIGKYDPDRFPRPVNPKDSAEGEITFGLIDDLSLRGLVTCDPREIKTYI